MKTPLLCLGLCLFFGAVAVAQEAQPSPPMDPVLPLRARLLDLAGALANEGFRVRDGFWSGRIEAGVPRRLAVNLFAGNQYWFCAAVDAPDARPVVALYDPRGEPVAAVNHDGPGLTAAGVTAGVTGRYVVEIKAPRGPVSDFCLLYLFK
jgi:hypothetical protein